ncbi:hypothetical protein D3C72_1934530 [compost metagenome]
MHEKPEAVASADQRQGRFRRAEDGDVALDRRRLAQLARMGFRLGAAVGRDDDRDQPSEGRQGCPFPLDDLALVEGRGIAGDQRLHHRMHRLEGLQQAVTLAPGAAGTAGHL